MDSNKKVSLLELDGKYMVGKNNKIMFSLNSQQSFIEYDTANIYKLVDPVYDQVFKSIFTYGQKTSQKFGPQRLISFLNSILHSKYGKKIVSIEYLPNDLVNPNGVSTKGMKVGDILLKAFFENDDILFIDIEIQTSFYQKIFKRWVENASRLFTNVGSKSLVLVLQIDETNKKSYSIYPCKKEEIHFWKKKLRILSK